MNTQEILRELAGSVCRCGSEKSRRQTFCRKCYFKLPPSQRNDLYRPIGDGYEEAYGAAIETLTECTDARKATD